MGTNLIRDFKFLSCIDGLTGQSTQIVDFLPTATIAQILLSNVPESITFLHRVGDVLRLANIAVLTNTKDVETTTDIPAIRSRLHETKLSLENITKAIETGAAPETLVKRMVELEKEKKLLEGELKEEEKGVLLLEKAQVIFWLNQFKDGDINDDDFRKILIDLFVNSVTVWDEPDDFYKITIAYNLTSLQQKTYRLPKGGTLSDLDSNTPARRTGCLPSVKTTAAHRSNIQASCLCRR